MSKSIRTLFHAPNSINEVPFIFQYIHARMATYFKLPDNPDLNVTIPPGTIIACDELIASMQRYIHCVFNDELLISTQDRRKRERYFESLQSLRNEIASFGTIRYIPSHKLYMAVSSNSNLRKLARKYKHEQLNSCDYVQVSICIRLIWG